MAMRHVRSSGRGAAAETHEAFETIEEDWEALAEDLAAPPWYRAGWFVPWWSAFGRGDLRILALRRDGRVLAVVPLMASAAHLESASNWHTPEFGMLGEADAVSELAETLFAKARRSITFSFVEPAAAQDVLAPASSRHRYRFLRRPLERSPYIDIAGDWAEYERERPSKLLSNLRSRRRKLEQQGSLTFDVSDGRDRLDALLDEGFAVEAAGWKGNAGTAISSATETERFYREIARWAAARGWLRLGFLRLGTRALAFDLAIEHAGVHYLLKTGFDPEFSRFGTGVILRYEMIARAFAEGLRCYDFLGDEADWKLNWTHTVRERLRFQAFAPSLAGTVEWAAFAYGRPAAKRLLATLRR
jgi:CelD/BcsL family acetyltransferase involved in cellulose biosynthesis